MSSVRLLENRLIQQIGEHIEELGFIEYEKSSGKHVLWLKDTFGVAEPTGQLIRANEYASEEDAQAEVLLEPTVHIWNHIWVRGALKREAEKQVEDIDNPGGNASNQESLKDGLREYLHRIPIDQAKELLGKVGDEAFKQAIAKVIKEIIDKFS